MALFALFAVTLPTVVMAAYLAHRHRSAPCRDDVDAQSCVSNLGRLGSPAPDYARAALTLLPPGEPRSGSPEVDHDHRAAAL